jgi:hypothetical protein
LAVRRREAPDHGPPTAVATWHAPPRPPEFGSSFPWCGTKDLGDTASIKSIDDLSRTLCDFAVGRGVKLKPLNTEAGMRVRGPIPWPLSTQAGSPPG